MLNKYIIKEEHKGLRLDKALTLLGDFSRSFIKTNLDNGAILVNGNKEKASYKLELNDEVTFLVPEKEEFVLKPKNMDLDICYSDDDVCVINKPKGMVVHPANGHLDDTLVSGLLHELKDLSTVNGEFRPGIVHRIDKDTSGLLIVAKNDEAHLALKSQLMDHTLGRIYYAIVIGVIEEDEGRIDAPIGRDLHNRVKKAVVADGKRAVTHFKVLERFQKHTLIECRLETGRTHQIRCHMAYIGYPVLGDPVYGPRKVFGNIGQYLHAKTLTFIQPTTKEKIIVDSELPKYFTDLLAELRLK